MPLGHPDETGISSQKLHMQFASQRYRFSMIGKKRSKPNLCRFNLGWIGIAGLLYLEYFFIFHSLGCFSLENLRLFLKADIWIAICLKVQKAGVFLRKHPLFVPKVARPKRAASEPKRLENPHALCDIGIYLQDIHCLCPENTQ